ncbi:unnamed protein product [Allacma fusca]|uniref:Cell cycle checkpoint control protein n=1 Tax=Allacma fusca TaxID=39272 RepID=A0A8J2MG48_9HEXA|nr:unnamed protein product [Allacma fusca]
MSIKCWISSLSLKCWGRVIQTLASAGESDIHFTITPEALTLYTYDSSHSVCCTCKFDRTFFFRYDVLEGSQLFCRIPSKCMLKPFKSLRFLQRCSDTCEIEFDSEANTMTIMIPCKGGVIVRHVLNFSVDRDSEELDFDPQSLKSCIGAEPKIFLRSLTNFVHNKGVAELTLKVLNNKLLLKNCVNDMIKKEGKVYTELMMNSVDFSQYSIECESELSFPMREFKTFVSFAEHVKTSLSLNFHGPNEPLLVTARSDDGTYCATLLLATRSIGQPERSSRKNSKHASTSYAANQAKNRETPSNRSNQINTDSSGIDSSFLNTETSVWATKGGNTPAPVIPPGPSAARQSHYSADLPGSFTLRQPENRNEVSQNTHFSVAPISSMDEDCEIVENDQNIAPACTLLPADNFSDDADEDTARKRIKLLFPSLGRIFDPRRDLPGYNDILVQCSDEEDT